MPTTTTTNAGLRHRLNKLSASVLNILKSTDSSKSHPSSSFPLTIPASRLFVALVSASIIISLFASIIHSGDHKDNIQNPPETVFGQSIDGLKVEDYPAVLVADSEPFRGKETIGGDENQQKEEQSSLVQAVSETEVTKTSGVDADEEPVARLIIITMDRDESLQRLLRSLISANYGEDHVDLDIWIDRPSDKPLHEGVLHACRGIDWKHGTKTIHKRSSNAGLYEQWIYTWNITQETTEFAVILEDDLEVSEAFYQWLLVARAAYAQDPDVGAFTLQRSTLRPRQRKGIATGPLNIPNEHVVFKYRLLGTWGFAPQRDQWVEFRKWFEEKKSKGEKPYVDGLVTTNWYKSQEVDGFAPTMWSQWWIKFADEKGYFTVTPHLPDRTTLAANWREKGLHYDESKKPTADFPLFRGSDDQFFNMPDNPILVDWDGLVISDTNSSTTNESSERF